VSQEEEAHNIIPDIYNKESFDNKESIENQKPKLTQVKLIPEIFKADDMLSIEASATDADGDEVIINYEWTLNGEEAGEQSFLNASLKRGDKFTVTITPFDGEEYGSSIFLDKEIANMPPMIYNTDRGYFDGETYTCIIKAADPDGDILTYSLNIAPEGMKIFSTTGLITWKVPSDFVGVEQVSVVVEDGQGGKAQYNLNINIKMEQVNI